MTSHYSGAIGVAHLRYSSKLQSAQRGEKSMQLSTIKGPARISIQKMPFNCSEKARDTQPKSYLPKLDTPLHNN